MLKCPNCDKTSLSAPGLKGHITKMHSKSKQSTIKTREEELNVEANKVVNLLLK